MKNLSFLLICLLAVSNAFAQLAGGPDAYGYTWQKNGNPAPGAPVYNWIDITSIGTPISGLGDDNFVGPLPMGINFRYYWSDYSQIYIGSNGYIGFQALNISSGAIGFPAMPTIDANNNFVAPMLADLSFAGVTNPGSAYIWSNNVDTCIVSYVGVPFWVNNAIQYGGSNTFQVIFSAADSSVTFQYQTQTGTYDAAYNLVANPVVVGMENLTGGVGLTVSNNTLPVSGSAVKFYYPNPVLLSVPDVAPAWVQNTESGGFFVSKDGAPLTGQALISNVGNADITTPINAQLSIRNAANTVVHTDAASITAGLPTGEDSVVSFLSAYAPVAAGTFSYQVSTSNTNDFNSTNNINNVEMVVVDTTGPSTPLSYWGGTAGSLTNTISWTNGDANDGVGIYVEPPFYPAKILSVDAYLFTTGAAVGTNSFEIRVYDDDAAPGQGTLLGNGFVTATNAISDSWNTVTLTLPIEITSGGFYVGWYMTGEAVSLGLDPTPPFSMRSYEVLFDAWSPFRQNEVNDPMIRVNVKGECLVANPVSLGADTSICTNSTFSLNAGVGLAAYLWSTGETTPSIAVTQPGVYTVAVADIQGCTGADTITVDTLAPPVLQLGADVVVCEGTPVTIDGGPGYASYFWSTASTQQSIAVQNSGTYSLLVTAANGCTETDEINVNFLPLPTVNLGADRTICAGDQLLISAPGGLASYLWSTGDTVAQISIGSAGTYSVQVSSADGCEAGDSLMVSVNEPTPDLGADQTICEGSSLSLSAGSFSGYIWSTGSSTPTISVSDSGVYSVTVIDGNGCTGEDSIAISLEPLPNADFTYTNQGFTYSFTNTTLNGDSYQWDFGDGSGGSTAANPSYTFLFPGLYTITLIASNDCGSDTLTFNLTGVGIDEELTEGISVYPNPNQGEFVIEFGALERKSLRISLYNTLGQEVYQEQLAAVYAGYRHTLQVPHVPAGVYVLKLHSAQGSASRRILIHR